MGLLGNLKGAKGDTGLVANYAVTALKSAANAPDLVFITDIGKEGLWKRDLTDTISADNVGTVMVDNLGQRWKRQIKDSINLRWFGAVGNGVTDDTIALQNWINTNTTNKKLILPEGNFITTQLTIPSNTTLSGAGKSSIITVTGTGNCISINGLTAIKIENISFVGNNSSSTTLNGNGVLVQNSTFITVSDCYFTGFGSVADTGAGAIFITSNTTDCSILNNYITGGMGKAQGNDITVYESSGKTIISNNRCYSSLNSNGIFVNVINTLGDVIVTQNYSFNHQRHGISVSYISTAEKSNSIISMNNCKNNGSTGIYCTTNTNGFLISNNIIESCSGSMMGYENYGAISLVGKGAKIVTGNYIANTGRNLDGTVRVNDSLDPTSNPNDPTMCTAIRTNGGKNSVIAYNTINGSVGTGITVYQEVLQVDVSHNQIEKCSKYGIFVYATGVTNQTKLSIKDNIIDQSTSDGDGVYFSTSIVRDNVDFVGNYMKGAKLNTGKLGIRIRGIGIKGVMSKNTIENFDIGLVVNHESILENFGRDFFFESNTISNCAKGMQYLTSGTKYSFHQNTNYQNNTLNEENLYGFLTFSQAVTLFPQKTILLASFPTFGIWDKNDRIININPTVGQPKSWVCTVSGTPGTWVSEGNL